MNIILFDKPKNREELKPLTLTRPIGNLRIGILTIDQKWQLFINSNISFITDQYLSKKFKPTFTDLNYYINASVLPSESLSILIKNLKENQVLVKAEETIAICSSKKLEFGFQTEGFEKIEFAEEIVVLNQLPDLFLKNGQQISSDFNKITTGRKSQPIDDKFTAIYHEENIFIEEGVNIKASILNAENGPIYIGKNAIIQEGSLIIGPVAIGENSMVAFGAKIRPNTTLGPVCRVGGEVGNSIFHAFTNKAHDGFLGNSYIGEWCNLGANTNNSNLKNDYKTVKLFNYLYQDYHETNEIFCGTFMGDFSKAGISTMFNTGTVVGVCANVFGGGFQEKHISSFSWGGKQEGYEKYRFQKAIEVINATMDRRHTQLSEEEIEILEYISNTEK